MTSVGSTKALKVAASSKLHRCKASITMERRSSRPAPEPRDAGGDVTMRCTLSHMASSRRLACTG